MFSDDLTKVLAKAHSEHSAWYNTKYDGKGGIAWKDDGGIKCSCEWHHPPVNNFRPWQQWHAHVASEVVVQFIRALIDDDEPGSLEFDGMRNAAVRDFRSDYAVLPPGNRLMLNMDMQEALLGALGSLLTGESADV